MTLRIRPGAQITVNGVDVGTVTNYTMEIARDWGENELVPVATTDIHITLNATGGDVRLFFPHRLRRGQAAETAVTVDPQIQTLTVDERLADIQVRLNHITTTTAAITPNIDNFYRELYGRPEWTLTGRNYVDATVFGDTHRTYLAAHAMTPEQEAAWREQYQAQLAAQTKAIEEERKRVRAANRAAMKLLRSHLTKDQEVSLTERGWFPVQGQEILYQVHKTGTVTTIHPKGVFCVYPITPSGSRDAYLPGPDQALAIKMLIEFDEKEFLRTANWSGSLRPLDSYHLARLDISGKSATAPANGYEANTYGNPDAARTITMDYWGITTQVNQTINEMRAAFYAEET